MGPPKNKKVKKKKVVKVEKKGKFGENRGLRRRRKCAAEPSPTPTAHRRPPTHDTTNHAAHQPT
jgi:hypothetical protein